jgi:hypothetical protein
MTVKITCAENLTRALTSEGTLSPTSDTQSAAEEKQNVETNTIAIPRTASDMSFFPLLVVVIVLVDDETTL